MSTIKADGVEAATGTNTDLTLAGKGTGVPDLATGFKVGGTAGLPINNLRVGTDGELITWDASGDPAAVAVGTATHVLTSNGAGAAPTFQAAAAGGAWTIIETQVASADATLDFTTGIGSTYDTYVLVGSALVLNTSGGFDFFASTDSGSSWESSYSYTGRRENAATFSGSQALDQATYDLDPGSEHTGGEMAAFEIWIDDPSNAADRKTVHSIMRNVTTGGDGVGHTTFGSINTTTAVDGFRIDAAGGAATITTGRVTLYGIAHA